MRSGKVQVVFNSVPVEFEQDSVILEISGHREMLPNGFVWIFAGGEVPRAFLKKIGVEFGMHDMTREGNEKAKQAIPVSAQLPSRDLRGRFRFVKATKGPK